MLLRILRRRRAASMIRAARGIPRFEFRMDNGLIATETILRIVQASKITSQGPCAQFRVTSKRPFSSAPSIACAGRGTTAGILAAIKDLVLVSSHSELAYSARRAVIRKRNSPADQQVELPPPVIPTPGENLRRIGHLNRILDDHLWRIRRQFRPGELRLGVDGDGGPRSIGGGHRSSAEPGHFHRLMRMPGWTNRVENLLALR